MRLLLVRHGQTTSNVGHHLDTAAPGASLTDLGRVQAGAVPEALGGEDITSIFVSNLVRTQETAAPLAEVRGLVPNIREGLREIGAGDYEMRNDEEAVHAYLDTIFGWDDDLTRRMPGGESGEEMLARFDEVVAEAFDEVGDAGTVVFFAHGAIIRAYVGLRAAGVDLGYAAHHWLPNTGMVALEGDPAQGWRVAGWTEDPLGGAELSDLAHSGPGGEPEDESEAEATPGE